MRPLARWTIGPSSDIGIEILQESIFRFQNLYPEFDTILCVNNREDVNINILKCHQTNSFPNQLRDADKNPEEASGCGWKLCPPRIRMPAHELWIDNDLLILKRIPEIDLWLKSSTTIISEGLGRVRMFGEYDQFVPKGMHLCAGLFGLPPDLDFNAKIKYYLQFSTRPLGGYDEQGLTAAICAESKDMIIIPNTTITILEDQSPVPNMLPLGIHFVGANRKPWHRAWHTYKIMSSICF